MKQNKIIKSLRLPLKREWFEMTASGVKREEYREITPYWFSRLFKNANANTLLREGYCLSLRRSSSAAKWNYDNGYFFEHKSFSANTVTLGYPRSADKDKILKLEHKGIEIREGRKEWGAEPGKLYFVIKHGDVIEERGWHETE